MKQLLPVKIHSLVLMSCSLIGLFGFYFQHHLFQITALIPFTVGLFLLTLSVVDFNYKLRWVVIYITTLVFGIILVRMSLKFIPQEFQPLRKRIYFPIMAISSILTVIYLGRNFRELEQRSTR